MVSTKLIGEDMIDKGLITRRQLSLALDEQRSNKKLLGKLIVDLGFLSHEDLYPFLASHFDIPFIDLRKVRSIPTDVLEMVPVHMARGFSIIPLCKESNTLTLAMSDPLDIVAVDTVKMKTRCSIQKAIADEKEITKAITENYNKDRTQGYKYKEKEYSGLTKEPERFSYDDGGISEKGVKGKENIVPMIGMEALLRYMVNKEASDLHLTEGLPPKLRVDGDLHLTNHKPLNSEAIKELAYSLLTDRQIENFERYRELDFSFEMKGLGRFRVNLHIQKSSIGVAIRRLFNSIPSMEELGLPEVCKDFTERNSGLMLITGPAGSGKSSTLASMIEYINHKRKCHIITIEDPIEYVHSHKRSTIIQRELGSDTLSFAEALKHVFRQDPNIILVGEMRDLETVKTVLTLAETGHLVLATLHTVDTVHSINRIVDVFPPTQQAQVRLQLSLSLIGVISQQLVPKVGGGRVLATEILKVNNAVQNIIRTNQISQIYSVIQTNHGEGMQTMNQSLCRLVRRNLIKYEDASKVSNNLKELNFLLDK